jgi:hypothetical protein
MRQLSRILLLSLAVVAIVAASARPAEKEDETPWEVVPVGSARVAMPRGWRSMDKIKPTMPVYRQGDGVGVPALDETKSPLQIGMTVEKFPGTRESVEQIMRGLVEGAKKAPRLELVGKESVQSIKLADGTEAKLLKAEFIKEGSRRSLQMKLVAKDADSNALIVSAHLVGGKDSKWPTPDSRLAKWLEAHVTSFSLDEKKFDAAKVKAAYQERDGK